MRPDSACSTNDKVISELLIFRERRRWSKGRLVLTENTDSIYLSGKNHSHSTSGAVAKNEQTPKSLYHFVEQAESGRIWSVVSWAARTR